MARKTRKPRGLDKYLPLIRKSVPYALSIAIHLCAILVITLTAKVILMPAIDSSRELPIIPQAQLADANSTPGGSLKSSNALDPLRENLISPLSTPSSPAKSTFIIEQTDPTLPGAWAIGMPSNLGVERGSSGEPTFGVAGAVGAQAPQSQFMGLGGNATRIVYIFDASASMEGKLKFLTDEVKASIALLKPTQSFNVLFFQKESFLAADSKYLIPATDKNKAEAKDHFLDPDKIKTAGATNPIPALQFAFDLNPQLVYLLTDGDFSGPGNPAVIQFCAQHAQNGKIKINTIAFTSPIPENAPNNPDEPFIKALKEIAKVSGGNFRQISNYSK
jgi:hypothetical protein